MKRAMLGATLVASLLLGTIEIAGASKKAAEDSATDATPDTMDIVAATAGHKKRKLVHTVTADSLFDPAGEDQVLLQMDISGDAECELEFIWPPDGKVTLIRCSVGEIEKKGVISQPKPDVLKFAFSPKAIGKPKSYDWRVITKECSGGCETIDAIPDEVGGTQAYFHHRLKKKKKH